MIKRVVFILGLACMLIGCGNENVAKPKVDTELLKEENTETTRKEQEEVKEETEKSSSWVKDLAIAQTITQIVAVVEHEGEATVSLHTKNEDGIWSEIFSVEGRIGKKGLGKTKEGDKKTPTGVYKFYMAFGILPDPGISALPYLQVDETHRWVDDSDSKYYNQLVSTKDVKGDWSSAERLYKSTYTYKYVLALNYNEKCTPGAGSAIFLHCPSKKFEKTSGCIAIPVENMKLLMQLLQEDCVIVIDSEEHIMSY